MTEYYIPFHLIIFNMNSLYNILTIFFYEERLHRNELSLHQKTEKDVQLNFCAYDRVSKMGMVDTTMYSLLREMDIGYYCI